MIAPIRSHWKVHAGRESPGEFWLGLSRAWVGPNFIALLSLAWGWGEYEPLRLLPRFVIRDDPVWLPTPEGAEVRTKARFYLSWLGFCFGTNFGRKWVIAGFVPDAGFVPARDHGDWDEEDPCCNGAGRQVCCDACDDLGCPDNPESWAGRA